MSPFAISFVAVSAVTPSLLLLLYFHRRDVYREPPRVVWTTFGLGAAITVPAIALAVPGDLLANRLTDPALHGLVSAFLAAAIPEELLKFWVLCRYAARHPAFDEPMDGVVYGVAASLGFATLENLLYVADGGMPVALTRALTAVPAHAAFGAVMGGLLFRARGAPNRRAATAWALGIPILLHGLYDFPLLTVARADENGHSDGPIVALLPLALIVLVVACWTSLRSVRRLRAAQLLAGPPAATALAFAPAEIVTGAAAQPTTATARTGGCLIAMGAIAAGLGGLVVLGVLAGVALGGTGADGTGVEGIAELVLGTAILGGLPAGLGLVLFLAGVTRRNRARPASAVAV